eukprot:TRINITY_DN3324_c0_g1_i1.p2 TRINITY_DN3324_c0_g1~~TRINITY_DN3324_c0_g1_i1.p2  ORF type:complete len:72 (-),score=10.69 TRINITY_DN3324_c0_g1_i1:35-226(-)
MCADDLVNYSLQKEVAPMVGEGQLLCIFSWFSANRMCLDAGGGVARGTTYVLLCHLDWSGVPM